MIRTLSFGFARTALIGLVSLPLADIGRAQDPPAQEADAAIRLPRDPAISPNGKRIAFAWQGDVWTADVEGGAATRLTMHLANDSSPLYGPNGDVIYFRSSRSGGDQIHVMPAKGGAARQLTFDSARKQILDISADGKQLLISQGTDRGWHSSESNRVFLLDVEGDKPKRMLFDAGVRDAALSPDGKRVLFCRGRSAWNRKGYVGPQAMQLWLADLSGDAPVLSRLDQDREGFQNVACMDPMWSRDGQSYFFNSDPDGVFEVYHASLDGGEPKRVTNGGGDDGVAFPCLARDGDTLLFRRGFDLVAYDVQSSVANSLRLHASGDQPVTPEERRRVRNANRIAFTPDGKQMAFVAGQDIWVMDRILKEPRRVTSDPQDESSLTFSADGKRLFFVSDAGGEVDIWEASHAREDGIWWMADSFDLRQVTNDKAVEGDLRRSPNGSHLAYSKGTDLFAMDADGSDHRVVVQTWSGADFDWSPDGRWLTYATQDDNYNNDVFVVPLDGTAEPFNLSRHPDSDNAPVWSADGKRIAWVGRRDGDETDIYWIDLSKDTDEATERDETLKKALKAMEDSSKKKPAKQGGSKQGDGSKKQAAVDGAETEEPASKSDSDGEADLVTIDFDGILDRIGRITIRDSREGGLIWMGDGSQLAFRASIDGKTGLYSVSFPRPEDPKWISSTLLRDNEWLVDSKQMVGLSGGTPASMDAKGKLTTFSFDVNTTRDWRRVREIAFDQGWRAMRDRFYDEAYNNRDWYQIRAKYRPLAAECLGAAEFSQLMNMMLGELNASHMGHRGGTDPLPRASSTDSWTPRTYHLGLRFDPFYSGPGLRVESVIPGGPCSESRSLVLAGETLVAIDGKELGPDVDVERLLTMGEVRELHLRVRNSTDQERDVHVRPARSVATLLYPEWVELTRARVDELSGGRLGYLHIRGMNFASFRQMEEDLFHAGAGKDGLVIDVRFNGGGSTTDHVLTALTQPVHAITQSRGSGLGYPQDRKIYASWNKPIVLLCNEHSFSNAEILSHAIKQIGRGQLVGMRTAGGVISTGSVGLLDGSSVRMPMRGWYLAVDGADMELNGCEPDICFWNDPDWNSGGEDKQLAAAVTALLEDVEAEAAKGAVKPVPASNLRR